MTNIDTNRCQFTGSVIADPCAQLTERGHRLLVVRIWVDAIAKDRQLRTPISLVMVGKLARTHYRSKLRGATVKVTGEYRFIHWKDQKQPRVVIALSDFEVIAPCPARSRWNPLGTHGA